MTPKSWIVISAGTNLLPYFSGSATAHVVGSRQRQVAPFQCVPVPPTFVARHERAERRIGSAVSLRAWRNVTVSCAGSWNSSWRCGIFQLVADGGHREILAGDALAAAFQRRRPSSPALVSSRAMMLPVQPMPTTTASTSGNFVAMSFVSNRYFGGTQEKAARQEKSAIDCGSTSYCLPRKASILSAYVAGRPG